MSLEDFKQPTISIESAANHNEVRRKIAADLHRIKFVQVSRDGRKFTVRFVNSMQCVLDQLYDRIKNLKF